MILYHATPAENVPWILAGGLQPIMARTKAKVVWLIEPDLQLWAARHCRQRHQVPDEQAVVMLRVTMHARDVEQIGLGRWWSYHLIPGRKIRVVAQYGPGNVIIV